MGVELRVACVAVEDCVRFVGAAADCVRVDCAVAPDRVRFDCAVDVQRAQGFDPGASLTRGSLIGLVLGGLVGGGLGALFGLINDVPGPAASMGAVAGGGAGAMVGGLLALHSDRAAYSRGLQACLAAHAAGADVRRLG